MTIRALVTTMPTATTAPRPAAASAPAVAIEPDGRGPVDDLFHTSSVDVVERERLRLEFEAIIAAGYGSGAEEPRPAPPVRRVATIVGAIRPMNGCVPSGVGRAGRPRPGPTAGVTPRERGPPTRAVALFRS